MHRKALVLTLGVAISAAGFSQDVVSPAPSTQRDPAAIATVQNAVNAMGGAAIANIQDCSAQATVQPAPDAKSSPYTITYKNAGDEFRIESLRDGKSVITATDATRYSRQNADGKLERLPAHMVPSEFPRYLAAMILYQESQDPSYSLRHGGTGTVNGRSAIFVSIRREGDKDWAPLTAQVWSFDAVTGLPLRVDWVIPMVHSADDTVSASAEFSAFRPVDGVLIPFQITTYIEGRKLTVETITSVAMNPGIDPAEFQLGGAK